MCLDRTLRCVRGGDRADDVQGLIRHVVNGDSRQSGASAVLLGLVDEGAAPAAGGATWLLLLLGGAAVNGRSGGGGRGVSEDGGLVMVELGEGLGEVVGVDELVRGVLEAHLPAMRGRGRGADEEQLAGVGQLEVAVLIGKVHRGVLAEVDAASLPHDGLAIPYRPHAHGGLLIREGHDDAAEGLERGPGDDRGGGGYQFPDGLHVVGPEDVRIIQVGDQ